MKHLRPSLITAAALALLTGIVARAAADDAKPEYPPPAEVRQGFLKLLDRPRVLRAETAPIAALTIVQALWGDSGMPR